MRDDFRSAIVEELGSVPPNFPAEKIEANIPTNARIICTLNNGSLLLLNIGVLVVHMAMMSGAIKKVELIPLKDIRGCRVSKSSGMFSVQIDRNDPSASAFGNPRLPLAIGIARTNEHALLFQSRLGEALNGGVPEQPQTDGPLEKIAKLKSLLDAGALTEVEFAQQKEKLLGEI